MRDFGFYRNCFENLNTARKGRVPAPHKPLLLLAVMEMIERGSISSIRIELSDELIRTFKINAKRYIGNSIVFKPNIGYPFYHLQNEPFWSLRSKTMALGMAAEPNGGYGSDKQVYSIKGLRERYGYAMIDRELYDLLRNPDACAKLRTTLISTYLSQQPNIVAPLASFSAIISLTAIIA